MMKNIEIKDDKSLEVTIKEPFAEYYHKVTILPEDIPTFFSYMSGDLKTKVDDLTLSEDDKCIILSGLTLVGLSKFIDLKIKKQEDTIYDDEELLRDDY
jgi:hypothetical protein